MSDDRDDADHPSTPGAEETVRTDDAQVEPVPDDARPTLDLDAVERDLAGVEAALERLDAGTYWTDETTGRPIPDEILAADPTARRADGGARRP